MAVSSSSLVPTGGLRLSSTNVNRLGLSLSVENMDRNKLYEHYEETLGTSGLNASQRAVLSVPDTQPSHYESTAGPDPYDTLLLICTRLLPILSPSLVEFSIDVRFGGALKLKPDGEPGLDGDWKMSLEIRRGGSSGEGRFMPVTGPRPGETGGTADGDRGARMPSVVSRRRARGRRRGRDSRGSMS